jgi:transcriptional regulator with XRE-family HTH domain
MSLAELGDYLRHAREVRGMSLRDLEHITRIRIKYLSALEEGDIGALQSDIQLYGFVRNYAKQVGLDPDNTISMLHQSLQNRSKRGLLTLFGLKKQVNRPQRSWPDAALPNSKPMFKMNVGQKFSLSLPRLFNQQTSIVVLLVVSLIVFFAWGSPHLRNRIMLLNKQAVSTPVILGPTITSTFLSYVSVTSTNLPPLVNFSDINLTVIVEQRSFVRVKVDGALEYQGILQMGDRRDYYGNDRIELTTGNGKGIRVIYNQREEGVMGEFGEVVTWVFSPNSKSNFSPDTTNVAPSGSQ